jgi:hypothetical protein
MASEGLIHHFGAVRLRLTGSGNLKMRLLSLDSVITQTLTSLAMSSTTNREPTRLCNFNEQRAQLEVKTTEINETFGISKIVVYIKPVASEFPG